MTKQVTWRVVLNGFVNVHEDTTNEQVRDALQAMFGEPFEHVGLHVVDETGTAEEQEAEAASVEIELTGEHQLD